MIGAKEAADGDRNSKPLALKRCAVISFQVLKLAFQAQPLFLHTELHGVVHRSAMVLEGLSVALIRTETRLRIAMRRR